MLDLSVTAILQYAVHHPAWQAAAIVFATFILEDAATVLAAMQAQSGAISVPLALGSLYVGIVLGDLGLYGLGRIAAKIPVVQRLLPPRRTEVVRAWLTGKVFRVVLVSRFLPGVRLPTYTTCGYLRADLRQFALATSLATLVWTSGLFALSYRMGDVLMAHFGAWRWAGAAGLIVFMLVAGRVMHLLHRPRRPLPDASRP
ncbi:MAG: VTT domain-containing protein [Rhodospirillales bacterium]|jgi:membrane protein DedA with SNARE-associated domain|nr:VTT domain-containing protein [Rhodospirillales bacterium]